MPFTKHIIRNGLVIKAVDYDLGREGYAYKDNDTARYQYASPSAPSAGNRGWSYRNDGVDIQAEGLQTQTRPGQQLDYHVFNIEDGEWLQYTVNVADGGKYTISLTIAAADSVGKISLFCNNKLIASNISVPATGGLTNWQTIELKNSSLPKGINQLRIVADKGGFNFSQMQFAKK